MDVNQTSAISPTHPDGRKTPHGRDQRSGGHHGESDAESGSWREQGAVDVDRSLMGALTPEVQELISNLTREMEPLRRRLEVAEHQVEEFHKAAREHAAETQRTHQATEAKAHQTSHR